MKEDKAESVSSSSSRVSKAEFLNLKRQVQELQLLLNERKLRKRTKKTEDESKSRRYGGPVNGDESFRADEKMYRVRGYVNSLTTGPPVKFNESRMEDMHDYTEHLIEFDIEDTAEALDVKIAAGPETSVAMTTPSALYEDSLYQSNVLCIKPGVVDESEPFATSVAGGQDQRVTTTVKEDSRSIQHLESHYFINAIEYEDSCSHYEESEIASLWFSNEYVCKRIKLQSVVPTRNLYEHFLCIEYGDGRNLMPVKWLMMMKISKTRKKKRFKYSKGAVKRGIT